MPQPKFIRGLLGTLPLQRHFTVFLIMTVFALAQLTWWVYYQVREGQRFAHIQHVMWSQKLSLAREQSEGMADHGRFTVWLRQNFPDLEAAPGGELRVKDEALHRLDAEAARRVRMFISEGVFFSFLFLVSVLYMYRTLKTELSVEHRQSVFIAATSHELKTPITSLRLYLDTLLDRDLRPEQRRELFVTMRQDVSRLNDLIESLLHAQAMMKQVHRELQPTDLSEETQIAIREIESRFDSETYQLNVDLDYGLRALADPERWQLIVKNLLDNAHKYSPVGGMIDVRLDSANGSARLTVKDEGVGFPPEESERIFERFYRIGSEDTRQTHGTGLGLFLVREISQSFGGRAYATSSGPGSGATFVVEVPLLKENSNA